MRWWILFFLLSCTIAAVVLGILMRGDAPPASPASAMEVDVKSGTVRVENAGRSGMREVTPGGKISLRADGTMSLDEPTPAQKSIATSTDAVPDSEFSRPRHAMLSLYAGGSHGNPLAGAAVVIHQATESYSLILDMNGSASAEALIPGQASIEITAPPILDGGLARIDLSEGQNRLDIRAVRRAGIRGGITGAGGASAAGAAVSIESTTGAQRIPAADLAARVSDASGMFAFDSLVPGAYILSVSAFPFFPYEETVEARCEPETHDIVLLDRASISVKVTGDPERPVGGARISLRSIRGSKDQYAITQTANLQGETLFEDISRGTYRISASHPWYQDSGHGETELSVKNSRETVELSLAERTYSISGRVYDEQSGEPIAGAEVIALANWKVETEERLWEYRSEPDAKAVTGDDGMYTIEGLRGGIYAIGAAPRDDYITIPLSEDRNFGAPPPRRIYLSDLTEVVGVDFGLLRPWIASGRVMLQDGTPLEGATIILNFNYTETAGKPDESYHLGLGTGKGKSGADGSFRFIGTQYAFDRESCELSIAAYHKKYQISRHVEIQPRSGEEISGLELVISGEKCFVSGTIAGSDGQPLKGARIEFRDVNNNEVSAYVRNNGVYTAALEKGIYTGYAWAADYETVQSDEPLRAEPGAVVEGYDFTLQPSPGEGLEGWISDREGNPIADLPFTFLIQRSFANGSQTWGHDNWRTDGDGRFRITELGASTPGQASYKIITQASKDYAEAQFETSERSLSDIHIVVDRYDGGFATVSGVVLDRDDSPVERYTIQMIAARQEAPGVHGAYRRHEFTHPNGAFILQDIPVIDGPFVIVAGKDGAAPAFSEALDLKKNEMRGDVVIKLTSSFSLIGRIVDAEGYLGQNASIRYQRDIIDLGESGLVDSLPHTAADLRGRFRLDGIPTVGGYLHVEKYPYLPLDLPIAIGQPGEERDLGNVVMQRRGMQQAGE